MRWLHVHSAGAFALGAEEVEGLLGGEFRMEGAELWPCQTSGTADPYLVPMNFGAVGRGHIEGSFWLRSSEPAAKSIR